MSAQQQSLLWVTPVSWDFNLNAVDFDGSTEYLANTSISVPIWSLTTEVWIKTWSSFNTDSMIFAFMNSSSQSIVVIRVYTWQWNIQFGVWWASWYVQYPSSTPVSTNTLYHIIVQHSWSSASAKLYINAVDSWLSFANLNTFSATATKVCAANQIWYSQYIASKICVIRHWDKVLSSSEITSLYNSWSWYKLDARNNFWNYASSSNLKHQWALWKDSWNIWYDYVSSWNIDLMTNAVNISSADIVTF